jgi:hypothetical protein
VYLFFLSVVYFIFVLYQVLTAGNDEAGKEKVVENEKVNPQNQ